MPEVVTLGEPLVQLNAVTTGPLRYVTYFERHVAGAEANVAVGAVRMGLTSGLISSVGNDEFGKLIIQSLRGEGVDVTQIKTDGAAPTGVYFVQRGYPRPGRSSVLYYRRGSAASRLGADDVRASYIKNAKWLHLTGITPALSDSCRSACERAFEIARKSGIKISFDTNIRPALWDSRDAKGVLLPMVSRADLLFTDPDDTRVLVGEGEPARAAKLLRERGPATVVIKLGREGAQAFTGKGTFKQKAYDVPVVDPIGAGDAFAAIFICGVMKGWSTGKCLQAAAVAGALVITARGDEENIPSEPEIQEFLGDVKERE